MKVNELIKQVEDTAELSFGDYPTLDNFIWFPWKSSSPSSWGLHKEVPANDGMMIIGIFQSETEVRVYALSKSVEGMDPEKVQPPSRYTLTKLAPTFTREIMRLETMVGELVAELQTLGGVDDDDEEGVETELTVGDNTLKVEPPT